MHRTHARTGATLVTCLVFLTVFLALGASLAAMSGASAQLSSNQQGSARAFASSESGLEVMRHWLSRVVMESTTPPSQYLATIVS